MGTKKISELDSVVSITGSETVEVVQSNLSKKSVLTKIRDWLSTAFDNLTVSGTGTVSGAKLSVENTGADSAIIDVKAPLGHDSSIRLIEAGVNQWLIGHDASANSLRFFNYGTSSATMRLVQSSDNVLIGTTIDNANWRVAAGPKGSLSLQTSGTRGAFHVTGEGITAGDGNLGGGLSFSGLGVNNYRAGLAPVQTGTDSDQVGLTFLTHNSSTSGDDLIRSMTIDRIDNTNSCLLVNTTTNNGVDALQVNGTAANTSGVWAVLSDERLKKDIRPVSDALGKVLKIADSTIHFTYKSGPKAGQNRTLYSAQKLQQNGFAGHISEVIPSNREDGEILGWEYEDKEVIIKEAVLDDDGNVLEEAVTETRTVVKTEGEMQLEVENNFTPYLFPAMAELKAIIDKQQEEIDELKKALGK